MAHGSCPPAALEAAPCFRAAPQQEWGWGWGWGWAAGDGVSPASSPEGGGGGGGEGSLSPCSPPARRGRRGRLGGAARQSASQREKLRMRRLAQALHTLRRFLPPSVAPAGRSLTKVETLRLASRYIAHLARLLRPDRHPTTAAPGPAPPALCAPPPAAPPPPAQQDLPAELLAFLDAWLPPVAQA